MTRRARSESHFVPGAGDAPPLHLAACGAERGAERGRPPLLMVHGATFSGRMFDIDCDGVNWLAAAADAGFAAYAVDLRGYGRSAPPDWRRAAFADGAPPACSGAQAIADIGRAADWIAARHGDAALSLIGWSWGTTTAARYAIGPGRDRVRRLALYAPVHAAPNPAWLEMLGEPEDPRQKRAFAPYRLVTPQDVRARWNEQIPPGADWRPEGALEALVQASLDDDPQSGGEGFRVPNGTFEDLWHCFNGRPLYDPATLRCPVLVVRGRADPTSTRADALGLFDALEGVERQYHEIADSTHFANAEHGAPQLHRAVHAFLRAGL
ncbi:alpha/beta fold hydrolase [Profundibacterium mesophilum]|uniref:Alphabeta hydrolase fold protein n=1 Tax=Profundibacterium mesophilum KAUST100406-0324 TaxID=1037889 RepID=A0A921NXK0_9RHOB|nr:alpha/beta hydrolase [Profundibacterium mesophilum]KAF0677201.1 Alphabeta hydrolase fold protein [Profundibacterium mesophilum KAUST100406-0324]